MAPTLSGAASDRAAGGRYHARLRVGAGRQKRREHPRLSADEHGAVAVEAEAEFQRDRDRPLLLRGQPAQLPLLAWIEPRQPTPEQCRGGGGNAGYESSDTDVGVKYNEAAVSV